jgi:hypothetical protein
MILQYRHRPRHHQPLGFLGTNAFCYAVAPQSQVGAPALGIMSITSDKVDAPLIQHPVRPV